MAILPVHQMIQQTDTLGAFREGEQVGAQNRLASLSGQAHGATGAARNALLGQMEYKQPGAGLALGDKLQSRDDNQLLRIEGLLNYMDQAEKTGDPQRVQQAWQRDAVPYLRQFAQGSEPTQNWAEAKPMLDGLRAKIAMAKAGQQGRGGLPAGLQEFQAMSQGLSPEDNLKARRVALGLDGRASTSGFTQVKFTDAQGRERVGSFNGRTGSIDLPDGTSFNPQTGVVAPTQGAGMPQPGGNGFQVIDVGNGEPPIDPRAVQAAAMNPNGDFVMGANGPVNTVPGQPQPRMPMQGGDPFTSRSAEEQAARTTAATEQAKVDTEMGNYRAMTGLEAERTGVIEGVKTQAAIAQAGGSEAARQSAQARVELQQLLPKVESESRRTVALIDKALNHPGREAGTGLSSKYDPRNYLPGTDAADFRVLLDQLKGGTFLQAFQSLKGGGAITQIEGQKAEQAIARLDQAQSDEQFMVALGELRAVAEGLPQSIRAKMGAVGGQAGGAQDRAQSSAIQRATNPQTGEVLELRNGAWVPTR